MVSNPLTERAVATGRCQKDADLEMARQSAYLKLRPARNSGAEESPIVSRSPRRYPRRTGRCPRRSPASRGRRPSRRTAGDGQYSARQRQVHDSSGTAWIRIRAQLDAFQSSRTHGNRRRSPRVPASAPPAPRAARLRAATNAAVADNRQIGGQLLGEVHTRASLGSWPSHAPSVPRPGSLSFRSDSETPA